MKILSLSIGFVACCLLTFLSVFRVPIASAGLNVTSKEAMVVSASPSASQIGIDILKRGGIAIDAAVATAMAISVAEPFSVGIGGGGFLLLYNQKIRNIKALDFRERAPLTATPTLFSIENNKAVPVI